MDQSKKRLDEIHVELMHLAKQERELLKEQKRLRCEQTHSCSVMDIINAVQIG